MANNSKGTKKAPAKNTAQSKAKAQQERELRNKNQMLAIVLFALGIFLLFIAMIKGESVWNFLHNLMLGLFGLVAYILPLLMVGIAVLCTLGKIEGRLSDKVWQMLVVSGLTCSLLELFGNPPYQIEEGETFFKMVSNLYVDGATLHSGGVLSLLPGYILKLLFGQVGAVIACLLLLFVFVMIMTGTTLVNLFDLIGRPVRSMEKVYNEQREYNDDEYEEYREVKKPVAQKKVVEKTKQKTKSHIFVAKEEDFAELNEPPETAQVKEEMPAHPVSSPKQRPKNQYERAVSAPILKPRPKKEKNYLDLDTLIKRVISDMPLGPIPTANANSDTDLSLEDTKTSTDAFDIDVGDLTQKPLYTNNMNLNDVVPDLPPLIEEEQQTKVPTIDTQFENGIYDDEQEETDEQRMAREYEVDIEQDEYDEAYDEYEDEDVPLEVDRDLDEQLKPIMQMNELDQLEEMVDIKSSIVSNDNLYADDEQEDEILSISNSDMQSNNLYTNSENEIVQYVFPPTSMLNSPVPTNNEDISTELKTKADILISTLESFGVKATITDICRGPTVTRYELQPSAGVKLSKITGLADDIALNLSATGVRIAPIPNKPVIGVEVPNRTTDIVTIREIIENEEFTQADSKLTVALGKDIAGNSVVADIADMPHVLIAGSTGSGKSVCINSIIMSILFNATPSDVKMLMIDPKIVELGIYNGIPHLLVPVVTDPGKASGALAWAVNEMEKRFKIFAEINARNFHAYKRLSETNEDIEPMPQILIIIDELADLMMTASNEVEASIQRLTQKARAAGIHLVIATQRPSVDVITGVIKSNTPSRIAFAVSSQIDSRTIMDTAGAEKLLGRGDMILHPKGMRVQGCFVSDIEVENVVEFIKNGGQAEYDDEIMVEIEKQAFQDKSAKDSGGGFEDMDNMFMDAVECVLDAGQASTSYLQRKLKIGYARAARLIDDMEEKGFISEADGSKPRAILISRMQWQEMIMNGAHDE